MEIKPLYRFLREDGGVTDSPDKPDGADYTTRYRLIASDGKLLTDGTTETYCIDVDSADGWSEIDDLEIDSSRISNRLNTATESQQLNL